MNRENKIKWLQAQDSVFTYSDNLEEYKKSFLGRHLNYSLQERIQYVRGLTRHVEPELSLVERLKAVWELTPKFNFDHPIMGRELVSVEIEYLRRREFNHIEVFGVVWGKDGSVEPDRTDCRGTCGDNEVRISMPYGKWDRLEQVCGFLQSEDCTVNSSTGLHVHLDQRHIINDITKGWNVANSRAKMLFNSVSSWAKFLVHPYRFEGSYCRLEYRTDDRYVAVNVCSLHEHGTIEVRFHSGSINPSKIKNWVMFLHWLVDNPCDSVEEFKESTCPHEIKQWALKRIEMFSSAWAKDRSCELEKSELGII